MFYIIVIFSLFFSAYAQIDSRPVIHLPPAVAEVVKQITADCLAETKAEPEVAKRFFELKFDKDEISKKFLYCLTRKTNYVDEDGHFNDGLITLFDSSDRKEDVQKRPVVPLPTIVLNEVKKAASECIKETGANKEVADNFFNLNFSSDLPSKKFLYCLCRKTNYGDEDGHLNDGLLTLFGESDRKDDVQKVLESCNKTKGKTNVDTIHQTVKCFYKNTPVLLVI
ncbi:unnamed protein product [Parnassius apollo]|uniref:(apollo) hypothetical protein n=1 Tax=Parnassius apollo TaxID=110799 RepID=A0A8S3WTD8_PARAO|nr:unnamed protein product [Parnassius apollo]